MSKYFVYSTKKKKEAIEEIIARNLFIMAR